MNEDTDFQVGKVLYVNIADTSTARMFDFMSSKTRSQGNKIEQRIFRIKQDYDYYIYGGQANYLESTTSTSSLELDWSAGNLHYGYFEVYTNNDHCTIQKQRDSLDFGPDKGIDYDGVLEELTLRFFTETEQIKQPSNSLNLGDLDDDDYDRLLILQTDIDSDGFPIVYQDWAREGEDEDGDEYPQWLFDIDGDLWFDKYDRSNTDEYVSIKREGEQSINILGAVGLVNSVFSVWVWFAFLTDYLNNTDFWFSWFAPCVVNGALWIPLTLTWPAATWGGLTMINIIKFMA